MNQPLIAFRQNTDYSLVFCITSYPDDDEHSCDDLILSIHWNPHHVIQWIVAGNSKKEEEIFKTITQDLNNCDEEKERERILEVIINFWMTLYHHNRWYFSSSSTSSFDSWMDNKKSEAVVMIELSLNEIYIKCFKLTDNHSHDDEDMRILNHH